MKKLILLSAVLIAVTGIQAQTDKSKRASPPAQVSETISSGATINIDYSQPALKGREIGKEVAPYGKVWRTGANEKTVFAVDKDVKVEGQPLPAGKYNLVTIPGENEWVVIFNKTTTGWGTQYDKSADALRVTVKPTKTDTSTERMTFQVNKSGQVSLLWGTEKVNFKVQ